MEWGEGGRGGESLPLDAEDEDERGLGGDEEGAILLAGAGQADLLALGLPVFFDVGFGALEDDAALFFVDLWSRG